MLNPPQVLQERVSLLIAKDRLLLQAPFHDFLQGSGNIGSDGRCWFGPVVCDGVHRRLVIIPADGSVASSDFIKDDPQRSDIGKMVDMIAMHLCRCYVFKK